MNPVGDKTMQAIEYALDALDRRAEVTAQNVANALVPGYQASKLPFEGQLRTAIASGDLNGLRTPTASPTGNPVGINGNNVRIEDEVVEMMKTNLLQAAMVEAFNFKVGLLETAIRGA